MPYTSKGNIISARFEGEAALLKIMERLAGNAAQVIEEGLLEGAEVIRQAADANEPRAEIKKELGDVKVKKDTSPGKHVTVSVGPSKEKWMFMYLESGAQAHEVTPEEGALKMYQAEGMPFAKVVQHPGIVARPFLRPAFDANTGKAIKKFGEVVWNRFVAMVKR